MIIIPAESIRTNDDFMDTGPGTVGSRRRITLEKLFPDSQRVGIYHNKWGEILIKQIVEIPASALWLLKNKRAFVDVQKGLKDLSEGKI